MKPRHRFALLLLACAYTVSSWASGVSPYLPLHISPEIERDIEHVLILAGKTSMTRPIPAATVIDALPEACELDAALCRRVQQYLRRYTAYVGISQASVEVAGSTGSATALPNARGMSSDSTWYASAHGYWQPNAYALVSVGGVAYQGDAVASGSMLSLGFHYAQLDIGYRDHWFSPFRDHAMLISTQAKTLPSVTLSNYQPISFLGLRYELFLAEMEHSDRIRVADGFTSGRPRLAGLHVSMSPTDGWSIAANRLMQYGGGARGGRSLSDFFDALIDPEEFDERGNIDLMGEFGNQQAAWTSEFIFPGPTPFTVYLEYAGEDRAYEGNYRFGNASLSLGLSIPQLWRDFGLTYEVSEWQNGWYVHGIYRDGMTNDGRVLGHWGGDMRRHGHGVGAQSHLLQLSWYPSFGGLMEFRARTISNEDFPRLSDGTRYERAYDLGIRYSRSLAGWTIGGEILVGEDVFGDSFGRLAAYLQLGHEWSGGSRAYARSGSRPDGAELFIDAGINANEVVVTLDAVSASDSGVRTDREIAPHFGIGARRRATERGDVGVRVELDQIDSKLLIAVRALDYRYRIGKNFAVSAFLGAARYDLATPALGLYGGLGIQWRNITPKLDLNLDARYADKVQRDKLLPDEPRNVRPDSFYDILSISLYLSYRW